jgi:hypothetical protein
MNVIKSFELDKEQIKAALTQWLNTCVLKEPCEIEEFELNPYKVGREVSITLKEKAAISLSDVKEVSDDSSI